MFTEKRNLAASVPMGILIHSTGSISSIWFTSPSVGKVPPLWFLEFELELTVNLINRKRSFIDARKENYESRSKVNALSVASLMKANYLHFKNFSCDTSWAGWKSVSFCVSSLGLFSYLPAKPNQEGLNEWSSKMAVHSLHWQHRNNFIKEDRMSVQPRESGFKVILQRDEINLKTFNDKTQPTGRTQSPH